MRNRSSLRPPLGVGILTVLTVLVVLLLCSFSVMSLLSANADANLTGKAKASVTAYYEADSQAERKVADIAIALQNTSAWQQALASLNVDVAIMNDHALLSFRIKLDKQALWVGLDQRLENGKPVGAFTRTRWQISSDISQ